MRTHLVASKARRLMADKRGASMVEYALLLFLILVIASTVYGMLGKKVRMAGDMATAQFLAH
jgi:Flp pilus assembly pilin Flp